MENLNEIRPKKHILKRDGHVVIQTDDVDMANAKWEPAQGGVWEWFRNGELLKSEASE